MQSSDFTRRLLENEAGVTAVVWFVPKAPVLELGPQNSAESQELLGGGRGSQCQFLGAALARGPCPLGGVGAGPGSLLESLGGTLSQLTVALFSRPQFMQDKSGHPQP